MSVGAMADKEILFNWIKNGYNPISVGWRTHTGTEKTEPVICEHYTIYYILAGTGTYTINHVDYRSCQGDMITCVPGDIFSYRTGLNNPAEHIWITFAISGEVDNRFLHTYLKAPYLQDVFAELRTGSNAESLDYVRKCLNEIGSLTQTDSDTDVLLVYQAIKYIRGQYRNLELSIADMANHLQVSQFKLVRAFSKVKNMPPKEYIIRYRLEKSCEFIRTQKYSLTEISELAGYKNYSTFARVFKKYYDITPKEYRSQCSLL